MFPGVEILGMDLYTILILLGIVGAIVALRYLSDKMGIDAKLYNFVLIAAVVAIFVGYGFAILFQSYYHWQATGKWVWGVGATFYGGLIGGALGFFAVYFIGGHYVFKDTKVHLTQLAKVCNSAIASVVLAHAFGRIGCLCAGCCYGKESDGWLATRQFINHQWKNVLPVQLYEALFLFAFFAVMVYLLIKKKNEYNLSIYLVGYGVWRFLIEYLRGDDERGATVVQFLSPSQLTAIIMIVLGVALIFIYKYWLKDFLAKFQPEVTQQMKIEDQVANETEKN